MEFMKFNFLLIILLIVGSANTQAVSFSAKECLDGNFTTETSGKESAFGLLKHSLKIEKNDCVITAEEKKFFVLKLKWKIDICREPIHLKKEQFKNTNVFKKEQRCSESNSSEFCKKTNKMLDLLRDVGLIFAEGNRQSIDSAHGKTYCAYLLAKEYLENDTIFVSGQTNVSIKGLSSPSDKAPAITAPVYTEETMDPLEGNTFAEEVIQDVAPGVIEDIPTEATGSF